MGRNVTLNNVPFTIVGVTPAEFYGVQPGRAVDLWLPLHSEKQVLPDADWGRTSWCLLVMGEA